MVNPTFVPFSVAELDPIAGLLDLGLPVGDVAHLDVEHVDLAVGREPLAAGAEHHGGVRELLLAGDDLGHAPRDQEDAELARPARGSAQRGPVEGLSRGANRLRRAEHGPLLGQDDELRAVGGRGANESLCDLEVAVVFVRGIELYGGGTHPGIPWQSRLTDQSI